MEKPEVARKCVRRRQAREISLLKGHTDVVQE